jgi:hypothetical protein
MLPTAGAWLNTGSGIVLAALGLWVLRIRPRRRVNLALAAFVVLYGLGWVLINLYGPDGDPLDSPFNRAGYVVMLPACVALAALLAWFPRPLAAPERGIALIPVAAWVGYAALVLPGRPTGSLEVHVGFHVLMPTLLAGVLLLALRFATAQGERASRERGQVALLAAGLLPWAVLYTAEFVPVILASGEGAGRTTSLRLVLIGATILAWLWGLARTKGHDRRLAGFVVGLLLGFLVLGLGAGALLGPVAVDQDWGLPGLSRTIGVLAMVYAILRFQLLGLDVKVKWTIKQSTVAAAFIGVFFVVSESASNFFASSGLGPYLGIAAAGLLVFAMAPLQRAAERVASAAMPGVKPAGAMSSDERARAYRELARGAWADGVLTGDERKLLRIAREQLRLSAEDAEGIEREFAEARATGS